MCNDFVGIYCSALCCFPAETGVKVHAATTTSLPWHGAVSGGKGLSLFSHPVCPGHQGSLRLSHSGHFVLNQLLLDCAASLPFYGSVFRCVLF